MTNKAYWANHFAHMKGATRLKLLYKGECATSGGLQESTIRPGETERRVLILLDRKPFTKQLRKRRGIFVSPASLTLCDQEAAASQSEIT